MRSVSGCNVAGKGVANMLVLVAHVRYQKTMKPTSTFLTSRACPKLGGMFRVIGIVATFIGMFQTTSSALDITTGAGITYKNCEVTKAEPDGVIVRHAEGVVKIGIAQ